MTCYEKEEMGKRDLVTRYLVLIAVVILDHVSDGSFIGAILGFVKIGGRVWFKLITQDCGNTGSHLQKCLEKEVLTSGILCSISLAHE